jgi:hypothetical protein
MGLAGFSFLVIRRGMSERLLSQMEPYDVAGNIR